MKHTPFPPDPAEPHFVTRARERGFGDQAQALYDDLRLALTRLRLGADLDGDYLEHMFSVPGRGGSQLALFRFITRDGRIGYALVSDCRLPITLITKEMVEHYRARRAPKSKPVFRGKRLVKG